MMGAREERASLARDGPLGAARPLFHILMHPSVAAARMAERPDAKTLGAFALIVVLAGINFLAVRVSNQDLAPFWGAALRFGLASSLFFAYAAIARVPFPRGRALVGSLLYGVLSFGLAYALLYWALVDVGPGLASVLMALVPLLTFGLASAQGVERFQMRGLAGALLALAGIALIFRERVQVDAPVLALLAVVGAAAAAAETNVILKRMPRPHPVASNAIAMLTGALLLLAASAAYGEPWRVPTEGGTLLAVGYLATLGSMVVFLLYLYVLARWTPSATSYQFVLSPLVAVPLGALLAGESVTWGFVAGGALVLAGVYVGALRAAPAPAGAASDAAKARSPR